MYYSSTQSLQVHRDAFRSTLPWGMTTESPCKSCAHRHENKNFCKLDPSCPLYIPTKISVEESVSGSKPKEKRLNTCQFPGCTKKCSGKYCHQKKGHSQLVLRRKMLHPGMPEAFYHMDPQECRRGTSLMVVWERMQAGKGL